MVAGDPDFHSIWKDKIEFEMLEFIQDFWYGTLLRDNILQSLAMQIVN